MLAETISWNRGIDSWAPKTFTNSGSGGMGQGERYRDEEGRKVGGREGRKGGMCRIGRGGGGGGGRGNSNQEILISIET